MFYNFIKEKSQAVVNCECQGILLICIIVGQGPIVPAVGAGGDCLDILFIFSQCFIC